MITKWILDPKGITYQLIILFFSILLFIDCQSRIHNEGVMPPGPLMILFSVFISCLLFVYGSKILNQKIEHKAIAIVVFALIPDAWIWYAHMHRAYRIIDALYLNIPMWTALCILIPYCLSEKIILNMFLTIFFLKGFVLFLSFSGFLGAPWLTEQSPIVLNILLGVLRFFLVSYQLVILGLLWRWLEKQRG